MEYSQTPPLILKEFSAGIPEHENSNWVWQFPSLEYIRPPPAGRAGAPPVCTSPVGYSPWSDWLLITTDPAKVPDAPVFVHECARSRYEYEVFGVRSYLLARYDASPYVVL